jgi:phosphoglycolate phosphatase
VERTAVTAIVFDLDGTLIDSAPDIRAAVNRMLQGEGLEPLDLATVVSFVGNGLAKLVERVMAVRGIDMAGHARLTQAVLDYYAAEPADRSRPYPGLEPALAQLLARGHRLGICTNKPEAPARDILHRMGLAPYFDALIGGDSLSLRKPDPEPLRQSFRDLGARTGLFVGDSEVDAQTAQRAGVRFLLFTEGYRKSPPGALVHHARFSHFDALPGLVAAATTRS